MFRIKTTKIKRISMKKLMTLLFFSLLFTFAQAQDKPAPSPASKVEQKVGLTDVTIEYSRPGKKDRAIFAVDGLVPYGAMWRTGANAATKITFSDDVKVDGKELAAGSYAVTTTPNKDSWAVHFYPYEGSRWSTYKEKDPAATANASAKEIPMQVETFLINIGNLRDNSAVIEFMWDNVWVGVQLEVN